MLNQTHQPPVGILAVFLNKSHYFFVRRFDARSYCTDQQVGMQLAVPPTESEYSVVGNIFALQGILGALGGLGVWIGQTRNNWHWIDGTVEDIGVL